jgi:hypothetical protein
MIALLLAGLLQAVAPASTTASELSPEALRDPYGYVLSQCSPLVLSGSEDPGACEARVWAAIRAVRPDAGPRVTIPAQAAPAGERSSAPRCETRQTPANGGGSSRVLCGSNDPRARDALDALLR